VETRRRCPAVVSGCWKKSDLRRPKKEAGSRPLEVLHGGEPLVQGRLPQSGEDVARI
jgi:hypothetical protein